MCYWLTDFTAAIQALFTVVSIDQDWKWKPSAGKRFGFSLFYQRLYFVPLGQGCPTGGPRAECGKVGHPCSRGSSASLAFFTLVFVALFHFCFCGIFSLLSLRGLC